MLKVIKTKKEFDEALERFNDVFNAPIGTPESDEADLLADLIEAYDNEHYPIEIPERVEAAKIGAEKG
ncbi:MAG: transcriptional regulator [Dyadobacter sp.]|uniref:transcriptional regulator n=1 Tax=Dyadobacter sp. TaxID=1914288 RepID=UPI001B1EC024|nr:transcriptional regulator [Dyadobacter sp.]MBO9611889.1 transcriptional regulator [Dyadobacter sp.]